MIHALRTPGKFLPDDIRLTRRCRVGWHRYGNCWRLRFGACRYSTVTYYSFWRLYIAVEK